MKKVYLFGAGTAAYGVISYVGKENIIAVIDNKEKLQGDNILEVPIISFEQFLNENNDEEIVITAAICESIIEQLKKNKICNYSLAPLVTMGNIFNPEQILERCRNKKEIFVLGDDIVMRKFCDYMESNHKECMVNVIPREFGQVLKNQEINEKMEVPENAELLIFGELLDEAENKRLEKYRNKKFVYEFKDNHRYNNLERYKKLHNGEKCFVVGNGPSLRMSDLEKIQKSNICSFGFNLIYNIYEDTSWRASYIVIADYTVYRAYYDDFVRQASPKMFIKDFYSIEGTPRIDGVNYYPASAYRLYNDRQKFSSDITRNVNGAYTVMYDAIQIAIYMGFKEIYLIGADFSYSNDPVQDGNHVYDGKIKDRRKAVGEYYLDVSFNALKKAREYADAHDIKIINTTRGGNLEIFERKNVDEVFEEIENSDM